MKRNIEPAFFSLTQRLLRYSVIGAGCAILTACGQDRAKELNGNPKK
jgi:hypothetical protein